MPQPHVADWLQKKKWPLFSYHLCMHSHCNVILQFLQFRGRACLLLEPWLDLFRPIESRKTNSFASSRPDIQSPWAPLLSLLDPQPPPYGNAQASLLEDGRHMTQPCHFPRQQPADQQTWRWGYPRALILQLTTDSQATPAEISRAWLWTERQPSWLITLRPNYGCSLKTLNFGVTY